MIEFNNIDDFYEYDEENNLIESLIDKLNECRSDYYKLYRKGFKVASIRLRQKLQEAILIIKQIKKEALIRRKEIERREQIAKKEAQDEEYL